MVSDLRLAARGNAAAHQAALLSMQQSYGNRAAQRFVRQAAAPAATPLQRQPAPGTRVTPAPARPSGGWNAGEVKLGTIRRIHLSGLSEANKNTDLTDKAGYDDGSKKVGDFTTEDATGQAVALIPDPLAESVKEVDVLLYLHGFGIGYRERSAARTECAREKKVKGKDVCVAYKDVAGMGAGTVRDVAVDRMDEQLAAVIKSRGQPMVAVMPQGAYTTKNGPNFSADFNSDKYISEVFSKVAALSGKTPGQVVLAGHSGAGNTIASRLEAAVVEKGKHAGELKTDAQLQAEGGPRLPSRLAEVVLFDSINGAGQRDEVETWLRAEIKKDAQALQGKTPDQQCAYLQGPDSMRFRAYHSTEAKGQEGYYTKQYDLLKANIPVIIKEELALAKVKLDPGVLDLLRSNYLNVNQQVPVTHEFVMGTGKVEEALQALPKANPPTACPPSSGTAPDQQTNAPADVQKRAAPGAKTVQRQPAPGTQGGNTGLTDAQLAEALVAATVQLAGNGGTLLRAADVETALKGRAANAELAGAFDTAVQFVATGPFPDQLTAIRDQAPPLIRILESQFIHDPKASTLDLLPPDRAKHYRQFKWHRLDYPGQSRASRGGPMDPPGPHEDEATAMMNELTAIRGERRPNQGDTAVVSGDEFNARMRRYVVDQMRPVPGQTGHKLNLHALESFVQMQAAAQAEGVDLIILDSDRSPERAAANSEASGNPQAVAATLSAHTLGLAMDLQMSQGGQHYEETTTRPMQNVGDMHQSPVHKWMFLRAASFGWYPWNHEPWHWEYNPSGFRDQFRAALNPPRQPAAPAAPSHPAAASHPPAQRTVQRAPGSGKLVAQRDPTKPAGPAEKSMSAEIIDFVADTVEAVRILSAINITFGPHAVQSAVSDYSIGVLKGVLHTAGLTSATITSTARTAKDQARAMFQNLEAKGVAHQKALYGPAGDAVIDVYVASKAAGKTETAIKADMEAKIVEIGPANVSRHCADQTKLNVFDVAPSSIADNPAFVKAAQAAVGKQVSRFIPYPQDPGHHFEIVPQ